MSSLARSKLVTMGSGKLNLHGASFMVLMLRVRLRVIFMYICVGLAIGLGL